MKQYPEKVTTGGLTGQGFNNLLGRPRLAPLPLVLREAVQNSWDARRKHRGSNLRFVVTIRTLTESQDREFRRIFDQEGSPERFGDNTLARQLRDRKPIRVLELADYGTIGLGGITRPDVPTGGEASRFVNFFFDIGRSHEESGDGGTYGFGRSSLYTAGKASLIVVDSLTEEGAGSEHRLMACRIGRSFEVATGGQRGRYSGRHFWGRAKGDVAQPLLGSSAEKIADALGFPARRGTAGSGTTILIPWPVDDFNDGEEIASTLLRHLWPKMVPCEGEPTIAFEVRVDGKRYAVPAPSGTEEYRLFVRALKQARTREEGPGVRIITTMRPRHRTGCLGVVEGIVSVVPPTPAQAEEEEEPEEAPPAVLNQIALMRPSELVVRYLSVSGCEQPGKSWAGVFICEDSPFVRTAFARAEPPAHDDWIADRLNDRHQKYVVRKTVQSLLPDAVREMLGIAQPGAAVEPENGLSLASTSARFSAMFLAGDGQGPAVALGQKDGPGPGKRGGGRTDQRFRLTAPVPAGLEMRDGRRVARFRATLQGREGATAVVRASASIHADGALETPPDGMAAPTIVSWKGGVADGDKCTVTLDGSRKEIEIHVAFHDDYGVALDCAVEEAGA